MNPNGPHLDPPVVVPDGNTVFPAWQVKIPGGPTLQRFVGPDAERKARDYLARLLKARAAPESAAPFGGVV